MRIYCGTGNLTVIDNGDTAPNSVVPTEITSGVVDAPVIGDALFHNPNGENGSTKWSDGTSYDTSKDPRKMRVDDEGRVLGPSMLKTMLKYFTRKELLDEIERRVNSE